MSTDNRWVVFADDAGDPSMNGSPFFGYGMLAIRKTNIPAFVEQRTVFRSERNVYREIKKGNIHSSGFQEVVTGVARLIQQANAAVAASFLHKAKYSGPWLRAAEGVPADPNYLRNYVIRKTLELLFSCVQFNRQTTVELVLDRVDLGDDQILNLRRYLAGDFTQFGDFEFPRVTHVTHADSLYVDGLQVADHITRLGHHVASRNDQKAEAFASSVLTIQTIVAARPFVLAPGTSATLSRASSALA